MKKSRIRIPAARDTENMNNLYEFMFFDAGALENMNNFREFMFPNLFPSKNAKRMRSSGEAYAHRSSSVTFSRNSGEAALVGVRKQNVGRPPAKAPFTGVAAPHPDSKCPQRRLPNNQKNKEPKGRLATRRILGSLTIILFRPYPLSLFR